MSRISSFWWIVKQISKSKTLGIQSIGYYPNAYLNVYLIFCPNVHPSVRMSRLRLGHQSNQIIWLDTSYMMRRYPSYMQQIRFGECAGVL